MVMEVYDVTGIGDGPNLLPADGILVLTPDDGCTLRFSGAHDYVLKGVKYVQDDNSAEEPTDVELIRVINAGAQSLTIDNKQGNPEDDIWTYSDAAVVVAALNFALLVYCEPDHAWWFVKAH